MKRKPRGMDRVEWRMCRRKTTYRRKAYAVKAAEATNATLRAYECLLCHYWHLTSKPEREFASEWLVGRYA